MDHSQLIEAIRNGDKNAIKIRLKAVSERDSLEICFRSDFGSFRNAFRSLEIGDWIAWDAEEYSRIGFHANAKSIGIEIATKKHSQLSCYIVMRII